MGVERADFKSSRNIVFFPIITYEFQYSKVLTKYRKNENMTIRYEANPPKILPDVNTEESIIKFVDKIKIISEKCDAIHITENVLGHQRVSPIKVGEIIKKEIPNHEQEKQNHGVY